MATSRAGLDQQFSALLEKVQSPARPTKASGKASSPEEQELERKQKLEREVEKARTRLDKARSVC
ncbi:MAG: hypothetical protein ABSF61_04510 [Anaerolineales bacterium]|jgi:hypothetical protein